MLRPALQELRREHLPETGDFRDVVDPKPESEQWKLTGAGHATYSSVAEHGSANNAAPAPTAPLPEPVATASATGGQRAHQPVSRATGQGATGQTDVASAARPSAVPPARVPDATGRPEQWEAVASDASAATARTPQHQQQELDAEEHRIDQVVQWLIEAEATNKKLSGAEVARRLEVAPRTGQRAVSAAKEVKEAREREKSRGHLRSVNRT